MEKLTAEQLKALKHGDKVYRFDGRYFRRLYFVALMPNSPDYLIFCDGEYLTHLYISSKDNTFRDEWYDGSNYDSEFVVDQMIARLEKDIQSLKEIYIEKK